MCSCRDVDVCVTCKHPRLRVHTLSPVTRYMSQGKQEGACAVTGGERHGDKGYVGLCGLPQPCGREAGRWT
jgi:hypothetical protein